jgi:uncharacterized protein (UPF0548 family)
MISFRRPSPTILSTFLQTQSRLDFTYGAIGATASVPPVRAVVDHTRVWLGKGEAVFRAARDALRRWAQFQLDWLQTWPPDVPIRQGEGVAIVARTLGLWWLNACRIVYVVEEDEPIAKFGYGCGTLPAHVGTGEERFLVEWDYEDGDVWYDLLAFSRPYHFLARLGYPYMRRMQKRFGRESAAAMRRAVRAAGF